MYICVICEYGWILFGTKGEESDDAVKICDASVVRSWRNGKGIGGIAKRENRGEYTLDPIGDVIVKADKVLFAFECEE